MFAGLWARTFARPDQSKRPLCSWCGAPTDVKGYQANWLEQRLARRIHNQRVRLRELERIDGWHREAHVKLRSRWMDTALRLGQENRELKNQLREAASPRPIERVERRPFDFDEA